MFFNALTKFIGTWPGSGHADAHGTTALRLCLQGRQLHFASPRDFAFSLVGRSAVPGQRLSCETGASVAVREAEWQLIERDIRTLSAMFAAPCLATALAAHGTQSFATDHDWRALFIALLAQRRARGAYLELALGTYIEFLRACQQVLRLPAEAPVDVSGDPALLRTIATPPPPALRRLPHGRAVSLRLEQGREVTIALARHRFALRHDQEWALVTDGGQRHVLRAGVNTIGRSRSSSIAIDSALSNVSRTHLLLEPIGDVVKLTDLSQAGTYIPPTAQAS